MAKFRQKNFGIIGSALTGAAIGTSLAGLANKLKMPVRFRGKDLSDGHLMTAGAIVGAALGTLAGLIVEGSNFISRKTTVDSRLLNKVVDDLKKTGFTEGIDFTRDPKKANAMKTRVCLVISKNSGDFRVLINTANDPKLKSLVDGTIKNIPNLSAVTEKTGDKFNEITITTISDSSADVGLVAGLAEKFIRNKFPVYLIEVG